MLRDIRSSSGAARRAGFAALILVSALVSASASALAATPAPAAAAGAAPAEPAERADAFLTGAALDHLIEKLMPVALEIRGDHASATPPAHLSLIEARYCGNVSRAEGRLLAIVTTAEATDAATARARLAGESDCRAKPGDIANRAGATAGSAGLAVIEVLIGWVPSQLRFSIGEIATNREGAALGPALARARAAGPIATVETAALTLPSNRGPIQSFNLAVNFPPGRDGVWLAAVPAGRGRPPGHEGRPPLDAPSPSDGSDAQVSATYPLLNRMLAFIGQDGPLVLQLNGQSVELRDLQVSGAEGALTVRGKATSRELQETLRLTIDAAGGDLRITRVGAEPDLESCADLSALTALACRARNAARVGAASATAAALTNRYRGELLRTVSGAPPDASVELDGLPIYLRLVPTLLRSAPGAVIVTGKIEIEPERPTPRP